MNTSEKQIQGIEKRLDLLWEQHKHDHKKDEKLGTYVDVDNLAIRNAGISRGSLSSPGSFKTWRNNTSSGRYFLEGFGAGRTRMFRR